MKKLKEGSYFGSIPPFHEGNVVSYYVIAYNDKGRSDRSNLSNYILEGYSQNEKYLLNKFSLALESLNVDVKNLTAKIALKFNTSFIYEPNIPIESYTNIPNIDTHNQEADLIAFNLKNNLIGDIFGIRLSSENRDTPSTLFFEQKDLGINSTILSGDPTRFPFDSYSLNLTLLIPYKKAILSQYKYHDDKLLSTGWDSSSTKPIIYSDSPNLEHFDVDCNVAIQHHLFAYFSHCLHDIKYQRSMEGTFMNITLDFWRNFSINILIIPLVAIFYLLGASFIFDNTLERLGNRLALTLGIIALIFTLNSLINQNKPVTAGPTIADSMLSIAIVSAIVFPISSILSSSPRIQKRFSRHYGFIDVIMFAIMSGIAFGLLRNFDLEVTRWLLPVIIFGLGYGLLVRKKISFSEIKSIMLVKGNPDKHDFY